VTSEPAAPGSLRLRLGDALQRERQRRGLSQSQLAKLAALSLKYIGEIERGEANATMDALGKIATALDWDVFQHAARVPFDELPADIKTLVRQALADIAQLVADACTGWLDSLDHVDVAQDTFAVPAPIRRRRGRPRKPREPDGIQES